MYKNRLKDKKIRFPKLFEKLNNWYLNLTKNQGIEDKLLDSINENAKFILDVYCKTGMLTIDIAQSFPLAQIIGMEDNSYFLKIAKKKIRHSFINNIEYTNLSNLFMYNNYFNCVVLYFALNDLSFEGIKKLLANISKVLKAKEKLIIADYCVLDNSFRKLIFWLYRFLFHRKLFRFYKIDLVTILEECGYTEIKVDNFEGIRFISCHNIG